VISVGFGAIQVRSVERTFAGSDQNVLDASLWPTPAMLATGHSVLPLL